MGNKLLIIRFSALGDVAMTAHLIQKIKSQFPDTQIYLLSKPQFYPVFEPLEITTISNDLRGKHRGIIGLLRLSREIKLLGIKKVADVHGVLRSYILDFFLWLQGIKVSVINKERRKKKLITQGRDIKLIHTIERYSNVLRNLGFKIDLSIESKPLTYKIDSQVKERFINQNMKNIGIAPFAAHKNKEYPTNLMTQVIEKLSKEGNINILVFGGGKRESQIAEKWANNFENVQSAIGRLSLSQEIALIGELDLIVTMDSGNMHLASLTKTKNIIIWGGTHPKMGFTPVDNYRPELSIIKNLSCQPCSVYGSEKCKRDDFACLYEISPFEIVKKIKENLQ